MPGSTATFGIPYPLLTDRLTDGAASIQATAEAVDTQLGSVIANRDAANASIDANEAAALAAIQQARTDAVAATQAASGDAIPRTLVDAKGDLLVGTAADQVDRLARGTTGQQLTVQADGSLAWAAQQDLSTAVLKAGSTMTGQLVLSRSAGTDVLHLAPTDAAAAYSGITTTKRVLLYDITAGTYARLDAGAIYDGGYRVYSPNNPPPAGGSVITQTIRGTATSTATIPSVNMAKTQTRYLGDTRYGAASQSAGAGGYVALASATSLTVVSNTTTGSGGTISYELTEWS